MLDPALLRRIGYRIALGPRAGQKVLSLRTGPDRDEKTTTALCAEAHGFSLHAGVRCSAHQRKRLERLCRYITRPAIANERLKRDGAGNVVLQLKSPWRDGTTHIRMSPLEFMQRLAALVPRPRLHLIRFGVRITSLREVSLRMAIKVAQLRKSFEHNWMAMARTTCMKAAD